METARAYPIYSCSASTVTVQQTVSPQTDEATLLSQVVAQNHQAFDHLYRSYAPRVRSYLKHCLNRPELIDDALQEVMLVLWQDAGRVPPAVSLIAWLCGVARHKARKALARAATPTIARARHASIDADAPEFVLLRQEYGRSLRRALDTLPPCERTALELRLYQGCSHQEIAAVTGAPVSTVRTRVARARQRLRLRAAKLDSGTSPPHDACFRSRR